MKKIIFLSFCLIALFSCNEEVTSPVDFSLEETAEEQEHSEKPVNESLTKTTRPIFTTFYKGETTDRLYYNASRNGRDYTNSIPFSNDGRTNDTPTSVRHGDNVYVYHKGKRSGDIFGQAININNIEDFSVSWDDNFVAIPDEDPDNPPSAIVFNDQVYIFYVVGNRIAYYRSDSPFFIEDEKFVIVTANNNGSAIGIPNAKSDLELGLAVHRGRLYCFYVRGDNDRIMYISTDTGDGDDWDRADSGNFNKSKAGLSAVSVLDNEILMTFAGITTNRLYVISATQEDENNGRLSFGAARWINPNAYTRKMAGIATNNWYQVSIAAKVHQTGNINIWKSNISGGQILHNWVAGNIGSGATSEGVDHLYLGF